MIAMLLFNKKKIISTKFAYSFPRSTATIHHFSEAGINLACGLCNDAFSIETLKRRIAA
jgi:hypothetical protein